MLVFASPRGLADLAAAKHFYLDGTFKSVPDMFVQLVSVQVEFEGVMVPCAFALISNKKQRSYDIMWQVRNEKNLILVNINMKKRKNITFSDFNIKQ